MQYWCFGGTFIGVIRHSGWIPYDGDIDVAMTENDYKTLQTVIQDELPAGMWFQSNMKDPCFWLPFGKIRLLYSYYQDYTPPNKSHYGLTIDIFPFKLENGILTNITQLLTTNLIKPKEAFLYSDIFPLSRGTFEDMVVYIPKEYKKVSQQLYGECPPPLLDFEFRKPHEGKLRCNGCHPSDRLKYPLLYKKPRVYVPGIFDLFHYGHHEAFKQVFEAFPDYEIVAGVVSDSDTLKIKHKLPILKTLERIRSVRECKFVSEVILDTPITCTQDDEYKEVMYFLALNRIDIYAHEDVGIKYNFLKQRDMFFAIKYTHGISTSEIIKRIVSGPSA